MPKHKFHNIHGSERTFRDLIRWMRTRHAAVWPQWVDYGPTAHPPQSVPRGQLLVTYINHSSILLQVDEINILLDPIWSERCSPFNFIGPKRVHAPGILFEDLPPIHLVLVSHNHYDHLDLPTLKRLKNEHHPRFVSGLGNQSYLEKQGITPVVDLDWWQVLNDPSGLKISYTPAQHFFCSLALG